VRVYAVCTADALRRKIEERGTAQLPEQAGKMYGELTMIVTASTLTAGVATEVVLTAGNLTLDRRAQTIVCSTAPLACSVTPCAARSTRSSSSRFKFTRDDALETRLTER
jgi:protein TonB